VQAQEAVRSPVLIAAVVGFAWSLGSVSLHECRAILDEFRNSLGEVEQLRDELGANGDAVRRWLAEEDGTDGAPEEFTLRGPPFASYFDDPRCNGFARAMQRMLAHYLRAGHYIAVRALLT
jgi:hypothetical protein